MTEKRSAQFKDILEFEKYSCGSYDSRKDCLIYTDSFYEEATKSRRNRIFEKNIRTQEITQITDGGVWEGNSLLRRDGRAVLFLSAVKGEGRQLFVYDRERKCTEQLTHMSANIMEPLWSPDGSEILFAAVENEKEQDAGPVVIEDFGYKFDGSGFTRPKQHVQLYIVSLITKEVRVITDGPYDYMHHNWSPDGKQIICVSSRYHSKKESIAADLLLIDAKGSKKITRLTKNGLAVSYPNPIRPVFTQDGKYVIMGFLDEKALKNEAAGYPAVWLYRIAVDGSEDICLLLESEECYDSVQFAYNVFCGTGLEKVRLSSDGENIYFLSGYKGQTRLFKINIYGETHQVAPLLDSAITKEMAIGGMGEPLDGKMLLSASKPNLPEAYYLLDEKTGVLTMLSQSNEILQSKVSYQSISELWFDTLDGESSVHGFILPPKEEKNMQSDKKYPCILYIHGGPHPFYTYGFTHEFQCFAGAGFGVLFCNPRGSSGYGTKHRNLERSTDGSAYMDCLQFVEEACRKYPWIDRDKIGVTGGSYGGYMTNYIATHSSRFRAFVSQRSVVSEVIDYASSDMQGDSSKYHNFEEFLADALKKSPISYVERVNAPFLILHGMEDLRTPVEGAHQLFVALKDLHPDLPVKMVLYPHTGHDQPQNEKQLLHYYHEMLSWFEKYLSGK